MSELLPADEIETNLRQYAAALHEEAGLMLSLAESLADGMEPAEAREAMEDPMPLERFERGEWEPEPMEAADE